MDFEKLKAPFDPKLISWRVGAMTKDKTKGIALAYIDARDLYERLDDVCGPDKWQLRYSHADSKTIAEIGIKIGDEWIWKANGAGDTNIEAEKGAISDAAKRAGVAWGIGRYLYDVQNVWVELDEYKRIKNPNDSRLIGALEKAAAGIRPQADNRNRIKEIAAEIDGANAIEDVSFVLHKHIQEIGTFSEAQQKYVNDYAANRRNFLSQQPQAAE